MKLQIREGTGVARFALPYKGGFVLSPGREMPVQAIVGNIYLAAHEPFCERLIPFEDRVPLSEPIELLGLFRPKRCRVRCSPLVKLFVFFKTFYMGPCRKVGRRREQAVLVQYGFDGTMSGHIQEYRAKAAGVERRPSLTASDG